MFSSALRIRMLATFVVASANGSSFVDRRWQHCCPPRALRRRRWRSSSNGCASRCGSTSRCGVYLQERVLQLKGLYHPSWALLQTRGYIHTWVLKQTGLCKTSTPFSGQMSVNTATPRLGSRHCLPIAARCRFRRTRMGAFAVVAGRAGPRCSARRICGLARG